MYMYIFLIEIITMNTYYCSETGKAYMDLVALIIFYIISLGGLSKTDIGSIKASLIPFLAPRNIEQIPPVNFDVSHLFFLMCSIDMCYVSYANN